MRLCLTLAAAVCAAGAFGDVTVENARFRLVLGDDAARPGMHYLVEIAGHGDGLEPIVHWQLRTQEGNPWRWRMPGHGIALEKAADGKRTGRAVVRVPEGVDAIRIMFKLRPDVDEKSGYDSAFLGRINY